MKNIEENEKEIKFLKILGFKKTWFDDGSAFWFTKKQKSRMLGKCEIAVESFNDRNIIVVDTWDKAAGCGSGMFTLIETGYSRKKVIEILGFLS